MTAVASPPSLHSLPRLGWNSINGISGPGDSMSSDDSTRMFMPRKSVQRTNSSSSVASSSSSTSTISTSPAQNANGIPAAGDGPQWAAKKKPTRGLWPVSKAEATSGIVTARPQPISTNNAGKAITTNGQGLHQPSPILPSQHLQRQQNGVRLANGGGAEGGAVLCLLPMNGTFERKQISVPFFPEVLRIGRQTNAKTVPTPANAYFDSKVLSRQHAEIWADRSGKILIRDIKSSNGTFVNGQRLSQENRESDPHELREHDILELGIDIVSEDQKEIVHHKVSAKVEFAGIPGNSNGVLDLNFGDIDPSAGIGLLPSPLSQPLVRGRPGSNAGSGRTSVPPSVTASQASAISQQRQLNFWHVPVNVDQVVKMLSNEMKHVKQQNSDLGHTGTFLQTLLSPEDKDKQQISPRDSQGQRQLNGRPKGSKVDPLVRFSDPPAPPPQQPLPEKPDAKTSPSDSIGHNFLKRSDTERPRSGMSNSPTNTQSSQILSLVDALSTARKELDTQGARVKQLEDLLQQERTAREKAEERALLLEGGSANSSSRSSTEQNVSEGKEPKLEEPSDGALAKTADEEIKQQASVQTKSAEDLRSRFDLLNAEMQEMKQQMEEYRCQKEKAEGEANATKASLAEMVERFRQENAEAAAAAEKEVVGDLISEKDKGTDGTSTSSLVDSLRKPNSIQSSSLLQQNGQPTSAASSLVRSQHHGMLSTNVQHLLTSLLRNDDGNPMNNSQAMAQSAPYASMLGVVLIGVGLMAYLNSWQGREK